MGFNVTKLRQMIREEVKSVKDSRLLESKLRRMISEEVKSVVRNSKRTGRLAEDADASKIDPAKFPTKLSAAAAAPGIEAAVTGGTKDGQDVDDKVKATSASFSCSELKPSQTSMNIDKAVSMAFGALKSGKAGGDLGAFISSDGYIMDGHHRWISTFMVDPSAKISGYSVNLPGEQLVAVLNAYTAGKLGIKAGKPATGGFEQFKDPAAMKASVEGFVKSGSDKVTAEEATKIAEAKGGVDGLVKMFMKNLSGATMSVPEWAPSRPDMPIIDEKDVPGALAALNNGEIDLNPPYHEGDAAGSKQNSGYSRSGTVVTERWQRLAGLVK